MAVTQPLPMSAAYGDSPPWHDVQLQIRGPAVGVLDTVFRERWEDPNSPDADHPIAWIHDKLHHTRMHADPLPPLLPPPPACGPHVVQTLRTYPAIRPPYDFAPDGERSVARGYTKAITRAGRLVYLEDQYMWSAEVARLFAEALTEHPDLHLVVVVPRFPDQEGAVAERPEMVGRWQAIEMCRKAGQNRVHVFDVENHAGTPVYVHAKVCVVDDVWVSVGSDNFNRRSWTHDSELSSGVLDTTRDPREPSDPAGHRRRRAHLRPRPAPDPGPRAPGPRPGRQRGRRTARPGAVRRDDRRRAPRRWRTGTRAAGSAPDRRAGSVRTRRRSCRCSPACGRRRSTA